MKMLKRFKQATLWSLKTSGVWTLVHNSRWRRQRLLILAYHGISLGDEHLWNGSQFISVEVFRNRLELLRKSRCAVLPLGEAVTRLYANDLPDRAVTITFDDGTSDFYRRAFPLIKEFGFPVNPHEKLCKSIDEVIAYCKEWDKKRKDLPYDTDGVVVKVNDWDQRETIGYTAKVPKWAKAFTRGVQAALNS